jgi:hypothetical protein
VERLGEFTLFARSPSPPKKVLQAPQPDNLLFFSLCVVVFYFGNLQQQLFLLVLGAVCGLAAFCVCFPEVKVATSAAA